MFHNELLIYAILFLYLPMVSFLLGTIIVILGLILKIRQSLYYKRILKIGGIFFSISFVFFYFIIILVFFYGIGPGMSE
jgi:hypothetical protein